MGSDRSSKKLHRLKVVSLILASMHAGMTKKEAIEKVVAGHATDVEGNRLSASKRSLYRWTSLYQRGGFDALEYKLGIKTKISKVLSDKFLDFLQLQKKADERCSIPNLIKAAVELGIVEKGELSRTTVWRAARKLNLPLLGALRKDFSVKKRFEYAHRMQMVLCDGKHFRAGRRRTKRVVFNFLDDSTRKVLACVVGKSENKKLFLRGLHKVLLKYGKMNCLYLDKGPGFIPRDVETVCARLGIHLIFGATAYPEGHGKIERFNRTLSNDLLRTFSGDPTVDAAIISLEMRIEYYLTGMYNQTPHEGIKGHTPDARWNADCLRLLAIDNVAALEKLFIVTKNRKVSEDNIVKIDGGNYEVPAGHSGRIIAIEQDFINGTLRILHDGKMVKIDLVNLHANAKSKRANPKSQPKVTEGPKNNAARIAFNKAYKPVVNSAGDFLSPIATKKE